jgi:hypothetical protein
MISAVLKLLPAWWRRRANRFGVTRPLPVTVLLMAASGKAAFFANIVWQMARQRRVSMA